MFELKKKKNIILISLKYLPLFFTVSQSVAYYIVTSLISNIFTKKD